MKHAALFILAAALATTSACQRGKDKDKPGDTAETKADPKAAVATPPAPKQNQVPPPPDVGGIPDDATKSASGLAYKILTPGKGDAKPGINDTIMLHYTGWKTNGETYFSTQNRGKPIPLALSRAPAGWVEVLTAMTVGEKRRVWMPPDLAFKSAGRGPQEMLVYEMEITDIHAAPEVPVDVAKAPANAEKTPLGVTYRVLAAGTGKDRPQPWDEVTVNFTAWTSDGKLVTSTAGRGKPQTIQPYQKGKGWSQAIPTMVVGQKSRFWIPAALDDLQSPAKSDKVFDIELVSIKTMSAPPPVPKDVAAPAKDAKKTAGGVFVKTLKKGTGKEHPGASSTVVAHYTGWTVDGTMFDSSVVRGEPMTFSLQRVIPGWTQGLQAMVAGETARLWIPEDLAYKGRPGPQGMLVFDVELKEVKPQPKSPDVPKDVAKPPADAQKTALGVFYKVLTKGAGTKKPTAADRVRVHYSGWTTDGKVFDSSVTRGQPSEFPLGGVIPGWTDGLQIMVEGEKTRFWIPEELAYKGKPGRPQGMLVFDVELIKIL